MALSEEGIRLAGDEISEEAWINPVLHATANRGMVFVQAREGKVLKGVASQKGIAQMILSKRTDVERVAVAKMINEVTNDLVFATVSYVGKASYREAEKCIRDFRLWTCSTGKAILIEISAVNGRFTLDFTHPFANPRFVNAFLKELNENGITYDPQDVMKLEMPGMALPWDE